MFNFYKNAVGICTLALIAACATIPTDFQEPAFSIMNIQFRNSAGLSPEFEITL